MSSTQRTVERYWSTSCPSLTFVPCMKSIVPGSNDLNLVSDYEELAVEMLSRVSRQQKHTFHVSKTSVPLT